MDILGWLGEFLTIIKILFFMTHHQLCVIVEEYISDYSGLLVEILR